MSAADEWIEISLVLTDDSGIAALNQTFLRKPDTTDVISFRYGPFPGESAGFTGEIIVNVQRAVLVGAPRSESSRELALYIAHGCDHLMGSTDENHAASTRMRRRELRWLKEAHSIGLLNGLIRPATKSIR